MVLNSGHVLVCHSVILGKALKFSSFSIYSGDIIQKCVIIQSIKTYGCIFTGPYRSCAACHHFMVGKSWHLSRLLANHLDTVTTLNSDFQFGKKKVLDVVLGDRIHVSTLI